MLKPNGAAELTAFTEKSYKETITPIVPGIWHVLGVGHSNAVIIEGRTSVILVDTLDTLEWGKSCWRLSGAGLKSRLRPSCIRTATRITGAEPGRFPVRTRKSSPSRQQPLC